MLKIEPRLWPVPPATYRTHRTPRAERAVRGWDRLTRIASAVFCSLLCAACAVGPNYVKPSTPTTAAAAKPAAPLPAPEAHHA